MPPFPPSSHRIIPLFPSPILFIPVPYRSVSSLFLLHSLSLSRSFHPLCGHVPPSLPLSSLSSLRFRPLPLSRRYFRDDELQYAPIVAAGNQRAYPKSSMVSTHPTQPKPSLAQPGTRPIRTYIYIYIYIRVCECHIVCTYRNVISRNIVLSTLTGKYLVILLLNNIFEVEFLILQCCDPIVVLAQHALQGFCVGRR